MATPAFEGVARTADLAAWTAKKSAFLFGPRQTGKSWLIRTTLPGAQVYDLLDSAVYLDLSRRPGRIAEEVGPKTKLVVIDEVQRLPALLNEVHRLIESRGVRFLLTGSNARSLRRGGVNLLGGRAREKRLHPLTSAELGARFDLARATRVGGLPSIYASDEPEADLEAYVGTYLRQEVVAEGAARNVEAFSRFLRVAAWCNATMVNFTKVANDAQVPRTTVHEYFEILKDTLLIEEAPAWSATVKRKPIVTPKFYFFDVGVANALLGRLPKPGTPEWGPALETWIFHELASYRDYAGGDPVSYWRSTSGFEVDFVLGDHTAIEVKATANVSANDLKGLRALAEEKKLKRYVCVAQEARRRVVDGVTVLPVAEFLAELWAGAFKG